MNNVMSYKFIYKFISNYCSHFIYQLINIALHRDIIKGNLNKLKKDIKERKLSNFPISHFFQPSFQQYL